MTVPAGERKSDAGEKANSGGMIVDLLGTTGVTMATVVATMATVALMARILERDEFLTYTLLARYFSLLIVVLGVGAGFSFIGRAGKERDDNARASLLLQVSIISIFAGFVLWVFISLWLTINFEIWPTWTVLGYFWVIAHTAFILSGPVARARGGVGGYVRLALGCRTAPYALGALLVFLTGEFMGLFVGFGVFSCLWIWRFWVNSRISIREPFDWRVALPLLQFGATRWLDDVVRTLLPVALIVATGFVLGAEKAAVVALVYLVARVLESILQPLVIAVMMRGRDGNSSLRIDLLRVVLFSVALGVLLFQSRPVLEALFLVFLGNTYQDITTHAWLMLMSASAIISINYLRACYDNSFSHSPVFLINLVFIVLLVVAVMWCDSVHEVVLCAVLGHAGRLVCYACSLIVLMGGQNVEGVES